MPKLLQLLTVKRCKEMLVLLMVISLQIPLSQHIFAQEGRILHGAVTDEANLPVVGAAVVVKGSNTGVTTDVDGKFSLSGLKAGDVLEVSFLGYDTAEVIYNQQTALTIVLHEASTAIDNVVVTALGIKRSEKALSYNVQQVSSDQITTVKDANFMNSLAGKVAGITINSNAAGPGSASRVVMRGIKSISGSNQALYVIDGVPMYNFSAGGGGGQPGTDGVADINPEDIESVSMLTGPSAAALYGNEAASGVVLITTKKGSSDKMNITYSNSTTFSQVAMMPQMQSKYGNNANESSSWGGIVNSNYDPRDFFRTGLNEINSLTLSAGNAKNQTFLSAASTNATNIIPNSNYNRYNFSVRNTTTFAKDKLTLDAGASYIVQNDKNMMAQGQDNNPLIGLYLFPRGENFDDVRMYERWNEEFGVPEQFWPYGGKAQDGSYNPFWMQNRMVRQNKKSRYMINTSLKWQVTDWLDITGRVKLDNYENTYTYKAYASSNQRIGATAGRGSYTENTSTSKNTYADVIATVNKTFGEDWSLNVNLGASINDSQYNTIGYSGGLNLLNFFAIHNIDFTQSFTRTNSAWHDQTQAVFANAEVGWKSMLYLTLSGRNDWDSHLAYSNYSSFFYPSVGLSAIVSNMFDAPNWLTLLKVRGSYTEVGSAYNRFMTTISYPYNGVSWDIQSQYPNLDLKPERTKSWEIGLDARFFGSLKVNLTYYKSHTYNQTFNVDISDTSGYSSLTIQTGNVMNEGVEFSLGYDKQWGDFSFFTNYTLTWNNNRIDRLSEGITNPVDGTPIELEDLSYGSFNGLSAGVRLRTGGSMGDVYQSQEFRRDEYGYLLLADNTLQMQNIANTSDYELLGSILPKANMGWQLGFGYKGLELNAMFTARIGGICLSRTQSILDSYGVSKASADARDAGGFVPVEQVYGTVDIPLRSFYGATASYAPFYTYSATNVRLNELSLNYTLPQKWFRNHVKMSIGFVGKNLWMIYCKAPFDPELTTSASSNSYQSFDYYMLPSQRTYGFSVKLQF